MDRLSSKTRHCPRPDLLASYMARSATFKSSLPPCVSCSRKLIPIDESMETMAEPMSKGCFRVKSMVSARVQASFSRVKSGRSTINSSPPRRAANPDSFTQSLILEATCCSRRSPASWPWVSLTGLKLSRSIRIRASFVPSFFDRSNALSRVS